MSITDEIVRELRRPFTPESVGFRVDAKHPSDKVRCVVYIDARLAKERLNDVDPEWTAIYTALASTSGDPLGANSYMPIECALTVCGVTRVGVGQSPRKDASSNLVKAAYSDALKRAAVEFGIGAYLYALKSFTVGQGGYWTGKDNQGKEVVKGLTRDGTNALRRDYKKWTGHEMFVARFGLPTEYGTLLDDDRGNVVADDDQQAQPTAGLPLVKRPEREAVRA